MRSVPHALAYAAAVGVLGVIVYTVNDRFPLQGQLVPSSSSSVAQTQLAPGITEYEGFTFVEQSDGSFAVYDGPAAKIQSGLQAGVGATGGDGGTTGGDPFAPAAGDAMCPAKDQSVGPGTHTKKVGPIDCKGKTKEAAVAMMNAVVLGELKTKVKCTDNDAKTANLTCDPSTMCEKVPNSPPVAVLGDKSVTPPTPWATCTIKNYTKKNNQCSGDITCTGGCKYRQACQKKSDKLKCCTRDEGTKAVCRASCDSGETPDGEYSSSECAGMCKPKYQFCCQKGESYSCKDSCGTGETKQGTYMISMCPMVCKKPVSSPTTPPPPVMKHCCVKNNTYTCKDACAAGETSQGQSTEAQCMMTCKMASSSPTTTPPMRCTGTTPTGTTCSNSNPCDQSKGDCFCRKNSPLDLTGKCQ